MQYACIEKGSEENGKELIRMLITEDELTEISEMLVGIVKESMVYSEIKSVVLIVESVRKALDSVEMEKRKMEV